jgi:hypothetical protein
MALIVVTMQCNLCRLLHRSRGTNVFLDDDDIIDADDVFGWLRPAIRHVAFKCKRICEQGWVGSPVETDPMPANLAADLVRLFPFVLAGRVGLNHELDTNPLTALDHWLLGGTKSIASFSPKSNGRISVTYVSLSWLTRAHRASDWRFSGRCWVPPEHGSGWKA